MTILGYAAPSVQKLASDAVASIQAPSGSMAANGAITLGTALPTTYANGYIFLPLNAIATGIAAGWFYVQMSSGTLGMVFNNTYTSGPRTIPPSPTPFVTTGPGAYTGVITLQTALSISVPGNAIGPNGALRYAFTMTTPNNGNNKTANATYSTMTLSTSIATTSQTTSVVRSFSNRGVTNSQVSDGGVGLMGPGVSAGLPQFAAIDSTQPQNFTLQSQLAVATDYLVIERYMIELIPG
jgi:hypothetical protein